MTSATSQRTPDANATFIAYTEPSSHQLGRDAATGEILSYPTSRIVAMAHVGESTEARHVGRADTEGIDQRMLELPYDVGSRIMDLMQERGILNCHGFANGISGRKRRNSPAGSIVAGNEASNLQAGETGLIGSPSTAYWAGEGGMQQEPGEALHSVVGISPESDEIIHVDTLLASPSIASRQAVVDQYARLTGATDTDVYHVPPPSDPSVEVPEINIFDPFDTN